MGLTPTSRLFFALWPGEETRDQIDMTARRLHADYGGRQVAKESLHITLVFLGETRDSRIAEIDAVSRSMTTPRFNLTLDRAGSWSGGIFWLAPQKLPPGLEALVAALRQGLKTAGFAFDGKRFVPHLTVLRRARVRSAEMAVAPIEFPVQDFVLVRTLPALKGVTHEVIGRFPLGPVSPQPDA